MKNFFVEKSDFLDGKECLFKKESLLEKTKRNKEQKKAALKNYEEYCLVANEDCAIRFSGNCDLRIVSTDKGPILRTKSVEPRPLYFSWHMLAPSSFEDVCGIKCETNCLQTTYRGKLLLNINGGKAEKVYIEATKRADECHHEASENKGVDSQIAIADSRCEYYGIVVVRSNGKVEVFGGFEREGLRKVDGAVNREYHNTSKDFEYAARIYKQMENSFYEARENNKKETSKNKR